MQSKLSLLLLSLIFCFSSAFAQEFKDMTAEELKKMIDKKTKMVVVDTREEQEFREGHIPRSINIPPEKVNFIKAFLPKDKKSLIVFYCKGWS